MVFWKNAIFPFVDYRNSIVFAYNRFIAISVSGGTLISDDGINWSSAPNNGLGNNGWQNLYYGNGLLIALSKTKIGTSLDGITWVTKNSIFNYSWVSVVYGNGLFVGVSADTATNSIMKSVNGIDWTLVTTSIRTGYNCITYGNGLFVAIGGAIIAVSSDGISWTRKNSPAGASFSLYKIVYGNGMFVAIADYHIITSKDGLNWNKFAWDTITTTYFEFTNILYYNDLFIINGYGYDFSTKSCLTSIDGINWTTHYTEFTYAKWNSSAYGKNRFVLITTGPSNDILTALSPILTNFSIPKKKTQDSVFTITAPLSTSSGKITYFSSNLQVAIINGSQITIVGEGTTIITASQAATSNYSPGVIKTPFTVSNIISPELTNFSIPPQSFGVEPFMIIAPLSPSSGSFTYTSSDLSVATISNGQITIVGVGTTTIIATQSQTSEYLSASTTASLIINKATTTLTGFSILPKTFGEVPFLLQNPTTPSTGPFTL